MKDDALLPHIAAIVSGYVQRNTVRADELPDLIRGVYDAFEDLQSAHAEKRIPFVPVRESVFSDFIICLEDGKQLRSLKHYLARVHGLTPDEYRRRWGLPANYPMVAPNHSKTRSRMAKEIGLGRKWG